MKRIITLLLFFLFQLSVFGQRADIIGGTPAENVTKLEINIPQNNQIISNELSELPPSPPSSSNPTGNSTEVGVTAGQLSVSLTGGAVYDIPIAVPPGINGVVPQISLSYNSQAGNGLAGYGWNITGVSVITRIPATKFHDGTIDAVDFDGFDRFSLDGQRLIVKNGTSGVYGADGTIYETESFSNIKVTSYGVHPNGSDYGPSYFKVEYPDGSSAIYGNGSNSRTRNDWAITYWQNPQGVRISYAYSLSNNNLSISTIKYGSRLTTTPINEISFIYKTRQRPEQAYIGGENFIRNTMLSEIKVKGNNVGFRNYLLTHETTSLGYQILKSITEKNGDNTKSFNPTIFNYETTTNDDLFSISDPISLNVGPINFQNSSYISGDFNGDGDMDFILYPTTGTNAKKRYWLFDDIQGTSLNIGYEHPVGQFVDIFPTSWLNYIDKLMPMQGWCVIQYNATNNITSFKNFSGGGTQPIYPQHERNYEFPKLSYTVGCLDLHHCDLNPFPENQQQNNNSVQGEPIPLNSVTNCPNPTNINLSPILNNQATLTWDQNGTPTPVMWEVHYFETGFGSNPSNNDPVGTYTTVNQNSFLINNLINRKNYTFFVRSICLVLSGNGPGNWVGPYSSGGLIITDPNPVETRYQTIPKEFVSGDFNGDGITDVIAIEKSTGYETRVCQDNCYTTTYTSVPGGKTYFVNLDTRLIDNFVNYSGYITITNNSKFVVADVNGDGKSDLLVFDSGSVKVYSLNNNNNQFVQLISLSDSAIKSDKPRFMGDFNGDGKADFLIPQQDDTDSWSFFLSKGNSFEKITTEIGFPYVTSVVGYFGIHGQYTIKSLQEVAFIANDINGDGKTDIISQTNYTCYSGGGCADGTPQVTSFRIFENKGFNGTAISFDQVYVNAQIGGVKRYPLPIFLDHNSHNKNLEYALLSGNSIRMFKSTKDNRIDTSLKEIILGNGVKEVITYQPLNGNTNSSEISAYVPSTYTEAYPNFDVHVANNFHIVSKLEHVSDNQYKQQKFKYYGAVSNAEGLGFLGFRELHKTNWFNENNQAITTVTKHDITKRGAVSETYTIQGAYNPLNYTPTNYITRIETTYEDELLSNKVYKIKNIESKVYNSLEGSSKKVLTVYDNFNNPLSIKLSVYSHPTLHGRYINLEDTKTIEYDNNTTGAGIYYIGRPKKTVTNLDGFRLNASTGTPFVEDTRTGEEIYTYNSSQLLTKVQKKGNDTNYLTEDNIYDIFGNITKKTITAQGLTPRVTEYTYDTSGRFLLTAKDIEGLVTTYSYNISNGSLLSETLPHNAGYPLTTTFEYDVWGKQVKVIDYLGKKLTTNYFKHPNDNKKTVISNTSDSGNISYEIYDQLGQKLATSVRDITASNWSTKQFIYDNQGKLIQESKPFFTSNPIGTSSASQWDTTSYDIYGRVTQQVLHTGKTTNITYNGLTTTSDDGIKTTTVTKNAIGNIVSLTDNGGTITYKYYADGNLKESDYGGIKVSIEQDGWGRKTKLIDPSAGIYTYEYNDFGELKKETTPNGTTLYILDDYGKLVSKSINGANTNTQSSYTYNPTTKLLEEVVHIDSQESITTTYTYGYDDYRRLWKTIESGALALFENSTVFDTFGRSEKEYHKAVLLSDMKTSGKTIKNIYKNGYHWQILDDTTNQVLWQTNTTNERGQLTEGQFGNGVMVTNTYDQYGLPSLIKHQKTGGVNPINMQLETAIDAQRGNLMGRTNNLFDWDETFVYDELDRLTEMSKSLELIHRNDFKETTNGFYKKHDTDAIVVISNEKLKVTAKAAYSGVYKDFYNSANIGDKFNVQISVDKGTTQNVRILIIEYNPQTGAWNESIKKITTTTGTELIDFQHTVTQYPLVALYIDKSDTSDAGTSTYFFVDDFKAHKIVPKQIVYDDRGRIENNSSIGEYLYENTASPYRNTGINLTQSGELYYDYNPKQSISYNAFKAPVDIFEEDKERLSFRYNASGQRSTMFYGDLNENKLLRAQRKHYSADGTMEIKHNVQTGAVEFITYIGGNAYTAPVVFRSSYPYMLRPSSSYLYLHRDYQGSIIAISNQEGQVVEKRLFDAWGNILKVQNGQGKNLLGLTILDRGYTGHEHLQAINIIHMNGRLYDPVVHRFLQPDNFIQDPFNTQNFNRYGYCLNNPFMYTDPSGEIFWLAVAAGAIIGAAAGGASYIANAIQTGNWSWSGFGTSMLTGAVIGAITGAVAPISLLSVTMGGAVASAFVGGFTPAMNVPIGDWNLSISPAIALGNASGIGLNVGVGYSDGNWSFSGGVGVMAYGDYNGFGKNGLEVRKSILAAWDDGRGGISLGTNFWSGDFNQRTTYLGIRSGKFRFSYENDGSPFSYAGKALSNNTDMYRTAAASVGFGDFDLQLNMFTGKSGNDAEQPNSVDVENGRSKKGKKLGLWSNREADMYRMGVLTIGYKGARVGTNSEHVRDVFQNWFAHKIVSPQPGFKMLYGGWQGYFQYNNPMINKSTLW